MIMHLNIMEILAAFMVLFAIIDILGSIPIILDVKTKTGALYPGKTTLVAYAIMLLFLFIGEPLLGVFGVDISSFAIAGSVILFLMGIEMVLGIQLFKHDSDGGGGAHRTHCLSPDCRSRFHHHLAFTTG